RRTVSGAIATGVDPESYAVRLSRPGHVADRQVVLSPHIDREPESSLVPGEADVGEVGRRVHLRKRVEPGRVGQCEERLLVVAGHVRDVRARVKQADEEAVWDKGHLVDSVWTDNGTAAVQCSSIKNDCSGPLR